MKLVKKFLLGLTAVAVAAALVSCEGITAGGDPTAEDSVNGSIIKGTTAKAYVGEKDGDGYENKNDGTIREMQLFATKHYGAFAALTLQGEKSGESNGQLGYVFNYTENKDGTVNFITIGFRHNSNNKIDTYVSHYFNVKTSEFSTTNFGATDKGKKTSAADIKALKESGDSVEVVIEELPTDLTWASTDENGDCTIGVEVIAEDDGSYTINYYGDSAIDDKFKLKKDSTAKKTVKVSDAITGYEEKTQTKLGCYAAVYSGKTLQGFWRFSNIKGEAEVAEFED